MGVNYILCVCLSLPTHNIFLKKKEVTPDLLKAPIQVQHDPQAVTHSAKHHHPNEVLTPETNSVTAMLTSAEIKLEHADTPR
jgi:hypothetical protein